MINRRVPKIVGFLAAAAIGAGWAGAGWAQGYPYTPGYAPAPPVTASPDTQATAYTADQLDQMLGPIALYPDPLLSQVLAASTYPQDIAAAGQWLANNPNPSDDEINGQPWDASVKALAHFPDVVQMMAENMDWTEALGNSFAAQQSDVMDSVQRLRSKAEAVKTLASTPQQQVVEDNGAIEIVPAQADVIYVPQYDPAVVYAEPLFGGPFITFGAPCPFGFFLDLDFDYHNHRFFHGRWDADHRHFDFDHGEAWRHDVRRPIPAPSRPFFPPRIPDPHRGYEAPGRAPGAFRPIVPPHVTAPAARAPTRPVTGLPARVAPTPRVVPTPRVPAAAPTPVRPAPTVRPPIAPVPRPIPSLPRPAPPARVAPAPPARVAPATPVRPVTGLPPRVVAPRPPVQRVTPAPAHPAAPPRAPSPVFRPSVGGAASSRGHDSLQH